MLLTLLVLGCSSDCKDGFALDESGWCWPIIDKSALEAIEVEADADADSDSDTDTDSDTDISDSGGPQELIGTINISITDTNSNRSDSCTGETRISSADIHVAGEWECSFKGSFSGKFGGGLVDGSFSGKTGSGTIVDMDPNNEQQGAWINAPWTATLEGGKVTASFQGNYQVADRKGHYEGEFFLAPPP